MTNYERIKNMSIEEMVKELLFIFSEDVEIPEDVAEMYYRTELTMEECWKQWLESEVQENER